MSMMQSMLAEFEQESATTRKLLELVPEDKLSWKPHRKSYSLGQLALHVASAPGFIAMAAVPDTSEIPTTPQAEAKSKQECLDALSASLAKAKELLGGIDDSRAMASWSATIQGKPIMTVPRAAFVRLIMMNHIYHHRGQLSVYLRLLDVPLPSIYGPSADTNPWAQ